MRTVARMGRTLLLLGFSAPAAAQAPAPAIQTQETNEAGVVADLTECRRSEGVLSIKVKLRNTGAENVRVVPGSFAF